MAGATAIAPAAPCRADNVTRGQPIATSLEVATSLWGRFMGLMGRPSLGAGSGLWLARTNGIHMTFMRFPIDAIFLGKPLGGAGSPRPVVAVRRRLRTWMGLVPFVRRADGVLEVPVGTIESTGTEVGDLVRLEGFE